MWIQLKGFNIYITYTGGMCLDAVQKGYDSLHWYPTAYAQWEAEPNKHYDYPALGNDVPIYFSIPGEPAGHVAVRLSDGRVASASQAGTHNPMYIHKNIEDLVAFYKSGGVTLNYLGWGEHCANLRIVEWRDKVDTVTIPKSEYEQLKRDSVVHEDVLALFYRVVSGSEITEYGRKNRLDKQAPSVALAEIRTEKGVQERLKKAKEAKKLVNSYLVAEIRE
jgi:hypothetical protein